MSQETGCMFTVLGLILFVMVVMFGTRGDDHEKRIADLERAMAIYMEPTK